MPRILIAGGSLGGLLAANLLHRAGHEVTALERSQHSLQGRGAGIVTHEGLRQALRAAGVAAGSDLGVAVAERVVLGRDGQALCRWNHAQILTSWGRLYSLLRQALPDHCHRLSVSAVSASQTDSSVSLVLASGEVLTADLLVAADGIRSMLRGQLLPAVQPQYGQYVAWRGVCDEAVLSQFTRRTLFPHFGFGVPAGEQVIGYPVAGAEHSTAAGQRRWNYVWYRPAAAGAELAALMTDADGQHHPQGIAPQQVSWRNIAAMREAARRLLAPQFAEIVEKTAAPFLQPVYDLASPSLAHGRIALLGDAAFVARPHVGMGVAKAADDAVALTQCLHSAGANAQAVRLYDTLRRPASLAVVLRARQLGAYLQAQAGEQTADHDKRESSRAREVMHQTAIDPRLFDTYPPQAMAT